MLLTILNPSAKKQFIRGNVDMKAITNDIEFRGSEDKTFKTDDGQNMTMKVFRFDDETGIQNEFYVMSDKIGDVVGIDSLVRGGMYKCELSIGKNNKVRLIGVYET